ncbi:MAG: phosphonate ABC transporter, permease protein PhnE [Pseudonocardia sp.]|nr:phosphonate ABC transporter, permease protein PhnE [Pseudonocardia sp.]
MTAVPDPPARWRRPRFGALLLVALLVALLIDGYRSGARVDPLGLVDGTVQLGEFLTEAVPPELDRLDRVAAALLVTLEMAVLGTLLGITLSIPVALAAARTTTPGKVVYVAARGLVSLCRTIPDLVWGLLFVVAVGLGPEAGVLAITADVLGFCGRFFAEAIEEVDAGLVEGVVATGAGRLAVLAAAVLPACLPAFVATSMFALENATRSSVVLGVVGAGGIGIELTVAMQLLRYDQALTVILAIFVVVVAIERVSSAIRGRVLAPPAAAEGRARWASTG